ncbi:unnamed protein product [Moneuplotes crassus]|uniref:Uncharacterized protein n=1 Tax=Euplotes crassus TaxID=5936 RepID=A0AAD1XZN4_EUPCR|nr:unnamed protein product [Moneuplotes crassus]
MFEENEKIHKLEVSNSQTYQVSLLSTSVSDLLRQKSPAKACKTPRSRWGRKQDKILFQTIRDMEQEEILTLHEFLNPDSDKKLKDYIEIQQLCERSGWKSSPSKLLTRIKSLCTPEFSFREMTLLKKILKTYKYQNIDYDKVIYEFPGKTISDLRNMVQILIDFHRRKDLNSFRNSRKKSVNQAP